MNLIFDYDGTLHKAEKIYVPAILQVFENLKNIGEASNIPSEEDIKSYLGKEPMAIWNKYLPNISNENKEVAIKSVGLMQEEMILERKAELYPRVEEIISNLKNKGHNLYLLSNCKRSYIEAHRKIFNLDRYFEKIVCGQDYNWLPKFKIYRDIDFKDDKSLVIGDRIHDIEVGKFNNIKSIACKYGYGSEDEFEYADYIIDSLDEIEEIIDYKIH